MSRIVLDTDVASLRRKGQLSETMESQLAGHELSLTFVTVGELARWAESRSWGAFARMALGRWASDHPVLSYSNTVSWTWGCISSAAERRGYTRPVNDTWIAACCLAADLPLATMNVKDFRHFAEKQGLVLITD